MQVPICKPSGEQIDRPGVLQEPVEEPVDAVPEPEAVAALEPDELSVVAGAELAVEENTAREGAPAAADVEATTGVAAAGDKTAAEPPEAPELPVLEA